jgi:hypothetical protein
LSLKVWVESFHLASCVPSCANSNLFCIDALALYRSKHILILRSFSLTHVIRVHLSFTSDHHHPHPTTSHTQQTPHADHFITRYVIGCTCRFSSIVFVGAPTRRPLSVRTTALLPRGLPGARHVLVSAHLHIYIGFCVCVFDPFNSVAVIDRSPSHPHESPVALASPCACWRQH